MEAPPNVCTPAHLADVAAKIAALAPERFELQVLPGSPCYAKCRFTGVFLIGSPINFADRLIGAPVAWHHTGEPSAPGVAARLVTALRPLAVSLAERCASAAATCPVHPCFILVNSSANFAGSLIVSLVT